MKQRENVRIFALFAAIYFLVSVCVLVFVWQKKEECSRRDVLNYKDFKAIWLSQYDMFEVYTDKGTQRGEKDYRKKLGVILDNIKKDGFNTLLVQVRPFGDSICASKLYPTSYILTGGYGREMKYDAFKILLEEAKGRALSVHAWINPLRAMRETEISAIDDGYAVKKWYLEREKGCFVSVFDGRIYLNPSRPEVRRLIVDGVREILEQYEVDGIHIDDYFYPTTDASFDSADYESFLSGGGRLSLADFRRNNLNLLVKAIYKAVKGFNSRLLFGVSPGGNYNRTYSEQYADIYTWGSIEGYVDYICPQIYFGFEHEFYGFEATARWWQNAISSPSVKLYIGVTFTKAGSATDVYAGSGAHEWAENDDVLLRSLLFTKELEKCRGVAVFSYSSLYDSVSGAEILRTRVEKNNFIPIFRNFSWSEE